MFQTEFEFQLPCGYLDEDGTLHRDGVMRRATAADEILPLKDARVQKNEAYLIVILLSRVITRLGSIDAINPKVIEGLFATDLAFLQDLYPASTRSTTPLTRVPTAARRRIRRESHHWGSEQGCCRLPPRSTDRRDVLPCLPLSLGTRRHHESRAPGSAQLGEPDLGAEPTDQRELTMKRTRIAVAAWVAPRAGPACVRRHRAFVDRLHGARRNERHALSVPLVLLRLMRPLLTRGAALINFALNVIARGSLRSVPQVRFTQLALGETPAVTQSMPRRQVPERTVVRRMPLARVFEQRQIDRELPGREVRSERSLTQIVRSTRIERHNAYPQLTVALARAMAAATSQAARQSATPHAEALQPLFGVQAPVSQPAMRDVLPPQELARVTEHVLAQLDRKVLSFRERHGQI